MDAKEYRELDHALAVRYNEYLTDCAEHEIQIGLDHREMARIKTERQSLAKEYHDNKVWSLD